MSLSRGNLVFAGACDLFGIWFRKSIVEREKILPCM